MLTRPINTTEPESSLLAKVGNVAPTLAILRLLGALDQPLGVNAIARELSIPPSSCFKILKQLQLAEFADFNPRTKCYSLGWGAIALARRALDPRQAFSTVRPKLEETAHSFGAAIGFWRRIARSRIVLAGFVEGGSTMRIHMTVGQRLPMLVGAVGRAFASGLDLPEAELRAEFDRLHWQAPLSFEEYAGDVREAVRLGFATDRNTFAPGVTTVAVAIRAGGDIHYGLSGITFTGQHDEETLRRFGAELRDISTWASSRLAAD